MKVIINAAMLWLVAVTAAAPAEPPRLAGVEVTRGSAGYEASCRLIDGINGDTLEEIEAGLETTIGYRLQIYRRRPGLPDQAVVKRRVRCTVRHDALTRQYTLTRRIDDELQETRVTPDTQEMREFLTVLERIPLVGADMLLPENEYYLKARSDLGLIWRFYLIPWRHKTDWVQIPIAMAKGNDGNPRP